MGSLAGRAGRFFHDARRHLPELLERNAAVDEMAGTVLARRRALALADRAQLPRAARVEAAAGPRVERARHRPLEPDLPLPDRGIGDRDRREEGLGVRVTGRPE